MERQSMLHLKEWRAGNDGIRCFCPSNSFKSLVEKGQGYEKAIDAASKGMNSQDWFVQNGSFRLFNALVAKGQQITVVKALKEKRIPIEKIMKITGLSKEEIEGCCLRKHSSHILI
jgi:hypothetical protein